MSYTKSYLHEIILLESELEFLLNNFCPDDEDKLMELESELEQRRELF